VRQPNTPPAIWRKPCVPRLFAALAITQLMRRLAGIPLSFATARRVQDWNGAGGIYTDAKPALLAS